MKKAEKRLSDNPYRYYVVKARRHYLKDGDANATQTENGHSRASLDLGSVQGSTITCGRWHVRKVDLQAIRARVVVGYEPVVIPQPSRQTLSRGASLGILATAISGMTVYSLKVEVPM